MADPARKPNYDINPNIKPDLRSISGGGQTSPRQGHLTALNNLENTPENTPTGSVNEREGQGSNVTQGPWDTKLNAAKDAISAASGNPTKSKSPLVAILIILFGGGFTFAGLFGAFSLLPINLVSQFFNKEDDQSTSFNIRTDKIINSKISKNTTSGICITEKISLLCKYNRPSNKLLKAFGREGIQAYDKSGKLIKSKGLFPNARPYKYTFKGGDPILAKSFSTKLTNDPEFRAAFHRAYTPRFVTYADNVFKAIKARFNFRTNDKNSKVQNKDDVKKNLTETSKGPETGARAAAAEGSEAAEDAAKKLIAAEGTKELTKVAKSGKGNAVGLISGAVCAIGNIPGLIIRTTRAYQLIQLINYAVTIVTSIEAMKANQASPDEVTAIGDLLTTTVDGTSAMDSFGIRNVLFGDTKPKNNNYKKFSPGASVISKLGGLNQFTSSTAKKDLCKVAMNPATGLAIDAATATTIIGPIINFAGGVLAGVVLEQAAPYIVDAIVKVIPLQPILQFFLGDLTAGLVGAAVGNALTSGLVHMMGQTANRGGNMALTVSQKLAYDKATKQVNLAYAEEDRATLSPFDATSPNTFLGSLVGDLLPYYTNMSSISGAFTSLANIVTGSFGSLLKQASVNALPEDGSQYQLCDDPALTNSGSGLDAIAAGPFCNIEYGIPPAYLNKDPSEVANSLIESGDINPITGDSIEKPNPVINITEDTEGEALGSYSGWLNLCGDGTTANAENCMLTPENVAANPKIVDYALYTIDHRVQTTMDGEDPALDPSTEPSTDTNTDSSSEESTTTPPATTEQSNSTPSSYFNTINDTLPANKLLGFKDNWLPIRKLEGIII